MCARTTAGRSSGLDQHAGGMPLDGCDATTAMHWYPRMGMHVSSCMLSASLEFNYHMLIYGESWQNSQFDRCSNSSLFYELILFFDMCQER